MADKVEKWPTVQNSSNMWTIIEKNIPKRRQELLKWNGWGYADTYFNCSDNGHGFVSTSRYFIKDTYVSQEVREYIINLLNYDIYKGIGPRKSQPESTDYPEPVINKEFLKELQQLGTSYSTQGQDRLYHSHGQTIHEIMMLRERKFERIPDMVVWPECHNDVVQLVQLASRLNVILVPFGGGTNVTRALQCPTDETRMIVSLDTSQMNRLLWVDKVNLLACSEAGILGQNLNRELEKYGVISGHEPDSLEFSTLGGWVATRASGMKKNQYGNIEDLVVHVRFVTPAGVLEKETPAPRVSCGPDLHHVVLGSEGTLGVITEVIFKVRPIPEVQEFDSYIFPTFQHGVDCVREIARKRYQPASLRLVDNEQYQMGQLFKQKVGWLGSILDSIKMYYVTKYIGIDLNQMCAAIAVFEGDREDVQALQKKILKIVTQFEGLSAGAYHGQRGYLFTYTIAYVRDFLISHSVLGDSFETSVAWDRCAALCKNVKIAVTRECKERSIKYYVVTCRVTQLYDTGACVYFYFAYNSEGRDLKDALQTYEQIEEVAREEILACGGSLSHHHGIGKIRSKWYPRQVSPVGVAVYRAIKQTLDPNNIFACGNLLPD